MNVTPVAVNEHYLVDEGVGFAFKDAHQGPSAADVVRAQNAADPEASLPIPLANGGADTVELDISDGALKGTLVIDNYADRVQFIFERNGRTERLEYAYNAEDAFDQTKPLWQEVAHTGQGLIDTKPWAMAEAGMEAIEVGTGMQSVTLKSGLDTPNGLFDFEVVLHNATTRTSATVLAKDGGSRQTETGAARNEGELSVSVSGPRHANEEFISVSTQDKNDLDALWASTGGGRDFGLGTDETGIFDVLGERKPQTIQPLADLFERVHNDELLDDQQSRSSMQDFVRAELSDEWIGDEDIQRGELLLEYGSAGKVASELAEELDNWDFFVDEPWVVEHIEQLTAEEQAVLAPAYEKVTGRQLLSDARSSGDFATAQIDRIASLIGQ